MNELISVIVPVYNVKKYLNRCVDSIINQTYKNLQIILVDDGSTDGSENLCDKYAETDNRILVIHKTNGGLSSARNAGLDMAKGQYIGFVDSDDYIEADMYEKLFLGIKKHSADICICSRYVEQESGEKYSYVSEQDVVVMNSEQALERIVSFSDFDMAVWDKLYRSELFSQVRFPIGKIYEDSYTTPYLFENSMVIVYYPIPLYHYIQRNGSITGSEKYWYDGILAWTFLSDFIKTRHPNLECVSNTLEVLIALRYIGWYVSQEKEIDKKTKKEAVHIVRNNIFGFLKSDRVKAAKKISAVAFLLNADIYIWLIRKQLKQKILKILGKYERRSV